MTKGRVGIRIIQDRHGRPMQVLTWDSGVRSVEDGRDLASVCRGLTVEELEFWLGKMLPCTGDWSTLKRELDRRCQSDVHGPLIDWAVRHKEE